jgi:uncharacterized membrane protein
MQRWDYFRLYGLVLIIISPLIVFGAELAWKMAQRLINHVLTIMQNRFKNSEQLIRKHLNANLLSLQLLSVLILIPYFLFTYGVIGQIANGHIDIRGVPQSVQLDLSGRDNGYFNEREMVGAQWIGARSRSSEATVSCDAISDYLLNFWFPYRTQRLSFENDISDTDYFYLRTWNIARGELDIIDPIQKSDKYYIIREQPKFYNAIYGSAKIYDNGGAQIFSP